MTELDLDAIDALANAVQHHRVGPARCACGYDAYKVGGFFPDYHAMFAAHLNAAPRLAPLDRTDYLALVAEVRRLREELASMTASWESAMDERCFHD